jgi:predicted permease
MHVQVLLAIVQIFGMFAIGILARRLGYVREEELDRWSRFIIDFLFPLLVFHSVARDFDAGRLGELWVLPLIGIGVMVFGAIAGIGLRHGLRERDPDVRKTFHHFCAINNYGFLPLVIVINLWGEVALAKLFFLNFGSNVAFWTLGVGLLAGGSNWRSAARNILSPSLIALALAFALAVCGWSSHVPEVV